MNVLNYIAMQKRKISEKHSGETYLCGRGEAVLITRGAREILEEMNRLEGLNVEERTGFSARKKCCAN